MKAKRQMDERYSTNGSGTAILGAPVHRPANITEIFPDPETPDETQRIPWWKRQLYFGGILAMAPGSQPKPPGFYVNIQTATFLLVVLSAIAGLWLYTKDTYRKQGYQDRQLEELQEKIKATDTKAEDARKAAYVNESESQPTPIPKETKKK